MNGHIFVAMAAAMAAAGAVSANAESQPRTIVETEAYRWAGDTIYQNEFKAWAEDANTIRSDYKGRPGYFMPVEQIWRRKNDLSAYPKLHSGNLLHEAIYNMGLDEMVNAVEPDTTLRTGKEWSGVWTRDVSYSIILSMAYMQPEAAMISLMKKVNPSGQIIQDTGSGGAWPISTDRMVWVLAAWEVYKVTGDKEWLRQVYPIALRSLAKDKATVMSGAGLVKGETSFIDWREQSYPRWMQTADISQSEAMGTNVMYAAALKATADMARILGHKNEAVSLGNEAADLVAAIDRTFYLPETGYYGMYTYGRDSKIVNPRSESLGLALAILYDIAPEEHQRSISENAPQTPWGPPVFFPGISDIPNYHNNALWPFVASYWTLAQAKAGNEAGVLEGMGSVFRPAAMFCTNKENLNLDNGDIYTELNSSNMLWSLSGNIALTTRILFGIHFEPAGLLIKPFVPEALGGTRTLENFHYRSANLDITVEGYGSRVASLSLNGKALDPAEAIPARMLKGNCRIRVVMDSKPIPEMALNRQPNRKAPLTPTAWLENDPDLDGMELPANNRLSWNPIEYIDRYVVLRDGNPVAETRQTTWPAVDRGEWQVIGVAADGTPSFASEPRSNRHAMTYQFANEKTTLNSSEISYLPASAPSGYTYAGFAETDRSTAPEKITVDIPEDGEYTVAVRYANGNGPVNTENKAAVRTLLIDGEKGGTLVMPQRGVANWDDWGMSNAVRVSLPAGKHTVGIEYRGEDENMNRLTNHALMDEIRIERVVR